MSFERLSENARNLLYEINNSDNPTDTLCKKYVEAQSSEKKADLRAIISNLTQKKLISVKWADNKPYFVSITNAGKTYEERLAQYERDLMCQSSMSISIGDNNKIKNSVIANTVNGTEDEKKHFYEKHPVISSVLISLVTGFLLLFSFWNQIVVFIENLFK